MKQIKFRAWDFNKEEMYYLANSQISEIHLVTNNKYWNIWDGKKRRCGNADKSGLLMQFTGLKDKNGVDIYEGDIMRSQGRNLIVFYQAPSFVMKIKASHKTWFSFILHPDELQYEEVIGNIHKNKDLIK